MATQILYTRSFTTTSNIALAVTVGPGKTSLAKSLYTRSPLFGRSCVLPGMIRKRAHGKANAIVLGHDLRYLAGPLNEVHHPGSLPDQSGVCGHDHILVTVTSSTHWPRG